MQQPRRERLVLADGHGDHAQAVVLAQHPPGRFEATYAGHFNVHQHHVRAQLAGQAYRFFPTVGLANHTNPFLIAEHAGDAGSNQIVVVDHQYFYHFILPT